MEADSHLEVSGTSSSVVADSQNHNRAEAGDWSPDYKLIRAADESIAAPTLVGFPFSGSGTALFGGWQAMLPSGFGLAAAALPGREDRLHEKPWTNLSEAADRLAESLVQYVPTGQSIVPVGFSIGAVLAMEVTRRLIDSGINVPLLVVASRVSPDIDMGRVGFAQMDDETFIDRLAGDFGAIPAEVLENREVLDLLLPALRGDLELGEGYTFQSPGKLPCDVLAAHGSDDETVRLQWLGGWADIGQTFRTRTFAGDHFFVREHTAAFLSSVVARYHAAVEQRN